MYTEEVLSGAIMPVVAANIDALTSTGVHTTSLLIGETIYVTGLRFVVTTATVSSADIVIKFWNSPTPGATTSQVSLGTMNIPTSKAAGSVLYKQITPQKVPAGSEITFEVITAAAGGGAAGNGYYYTQQSYSPEVLTNFTDHAVAT
jgi:hypothetical protein